MRGDFNSVKECVAGDVDSGLYESSARLLPIAKEFNSAELTMLFDDWSPYSCVLLRVEVLVWVSDLKSLSPASVTLGLRNSNKQLFNEPLRDAVCCVLNSLRYF
jgi:hypothetical protein